MPKKLRKKFFLLLKDVEICSKQFALLFCIHLKKSLAESRWMLELKTYEQNVLLKQISRKWFNQFKILRQQIKKVQVNHKSLWQNSQKY